MLSCIGCDNHGFENASAGMHPHNVRHIVTSQHMLILHFRMCMMQEIAQGTSRTCPNSEGKHILHLPILGSMYCLFALRLKLCSRRSCNEQRADAFGLD